MKVSKDFYWEMGHRLPFHQGLCKNFHGHSYRASVIMEGEPDTNGMVIDFYEMKQLMRPIIEQLDHAFVLYEQDTDAIESMTKLSTKIKLMPFQTTAENLCRYILSQLSKQVPANIASVTVRLYETNDAFAEDTIIIK
jgi:6-pyruvoyltetrahydropterin/6-carboxytetrahydropterin synthase